MEFDDIAKNTLLNLSEAFGKTYVSRPDIISPNSIGIELEIRFKYLFPELHQKYFTSNAAYYNLSEEKREQISQEVSEAEKDILSSFEKTIECGIPRGLDKYWEFSFTPTYNLVFIVYQLDILKQAGMIPPGKHSFHITVGDSKIAPEKYWILFALELLYCSKERIKSGFSKYAGLSATWAKKGDGGILVKNEHDLANSSEGFELRTLQFDGDLDLLHEMLTLLCRFLRGENNLVTVVKAKAIELGFPNENWKRPNINPDVWNLYIEKFDELSTFAKEFHLSAKNKIHTLAT